MATRADRVDEDKTPREERGAQASAAVTHPPRPVAEAPIGDVIKRSAAKHREALEILAKR